MTNKKQTREEELYTFTKILEAQYNGKLDNKNLHHYLIQTLKKQGMPSYHLKSQPKSQDSEPKNVEHIPISDHKSAVKRRRYPGSGSDSGGGSGGGGIHNNKKEGEDKQTKELQGRLTDSSHNDNNREPKPCSNQNIASLKSASLSEPECSQLSPSSYLDDSPIVLVNETISEELSQDIKAPSISPASFAPPSPSLSPDPNSAPHKGNDVVDVQLLRDDLDDFEILPRPKSHNASLLSKTKSTTKKNKTNISLPSKKSSSTNKSHQQSTLIQQTRRSSKLKRSEGKKNCFDVDSSDDFVMPKGMQRQSPNAVQRKQKPTTSKTSPRKKNSNFLAVLVLHLCSLLMMTFRLRCSCSKSM